ncbi:MAG TPA: oligosaccharide flippase family protein [Candidatus Binataceae bacterium]|nr:oligosaccharide flippase family protein [Candidatus Binataceae bacterium]
MRFSTFGITSVRRNLSANLISRILSGLVNLACVPIFLRVLGVSGYGLIGVWALLETFANLLDFGLSSTITREMAASSRKAGNADHIRDLVRTLELGYWSIGAILAGVIVLAAPVLARSWLHSNTVAESSLRSVVVLIGFLIFSRWPMSFYGGGLSGLERQVLLSWISLFFTATRNLGAAVVILLASPTTWAFFAWQLIINSIQTVILAVLLWHCLPAGSKPIPRLSLIRSIRRFAGGVTAVTIVSMVLTELDKIVISKQLSLEAFGYYSLAWQIAGSLYLVSTPVFTALFPAFARHVTAQDTPRLTEIYHHAAQVISILVLPAATTFIFLARQLVFAWTGSQQTAAHTWLAASLLTAGTAFNCIVSIPYALQLAYGCTAIAFWTNLASAFVTVPLLLLLTARFGSSGAAAVWLLINVSYLVTQVQLMHRRFLSRECLRWYLHDLAIPLFACVVVSCLVARFSFTVTTRMGILSLALLNGVLAFGAASLSIPLIRKQIRELAASTRHAFSL